MMRKQWKKLNRAYGIFQAKYFLDGFEGLEELNFGDFSREVILFNHKDLMGVSLGANQIMLNKKLTFDKNKSARDFILLHEEGHSKDNSILTILTGLSQTILTPLGFGALFLGLIISFLRDPLTPLPLKLLEIERIITNVGVSLSLLLTASTISYIGEIKADLFVIEKIGIKEFIETDEKLQKLADTGLIERIFWRLSHPPSTLTARIYDKMNK